jgi:hypothetical protein
MAQETGAVGWDVVTHRGGGDLTWWSFLAFAGCGVGCYVLWRLAWWFAGKGMDAVGWRAKRYWWPTAMVACGWLLPVVVRFGRGPVSGALLVALVILNFPALLVAGFLAECLRWLPVWLLAVVASTTAWLTWHAIVRFLEWRIRERQPVSLHLG